MSPTSSPESKAIARAALRRAEEGQLNGEVKAVHGLERAPEGL